MPNAHIVRARCGGLCIRGDDILGLVARIPGGTILDVLGADGAMNAGVFVVIDLLGVGLLSLHGYDLQRPPIRIAFGWFSRGCLLLGYRDEHRCGSFVMRPGRGLYIGAVQTVTRRCDIGIAGAVTSCPRLGG